MDVTTQFYYLSPPQPLAVGTLLRPIAWISEDAPLSDFLAGPETETSLVALSPASSMVLAQHFDQDILGDMGKLWNTFIESGQVWALGIGIVVGYLIRNLTAY